MERNDSSNPFQLHQQAQSSSRNLQDSELALSQPPPPSNPDSQGVQPPSSTVHQSPARITRASQRSKKESPTTDEQSAPSAPNSNSRPATAHPATLRRSARLSAAQATLAHNPSTPAGSRSTPPAASSSSRKLPSASTATDAGTQPTSTDRKGKKRVTRDRTPSNSDQSDELEPSLKRVKKTPSDRSLQAESSTTAQNSKGKGKEVDNSKSTKSMPKKSIPKSKRGGASGANDRTKKGDSSARHLIDDRMDPDVARWDQPGGSHGLLDEDDYHEDEDMEDSDHDEDDDDHDDEDGLGARGGMSAYGRLAAFADGSLFDEATAAALFGGAEFRGFGGLMSSFSNRFKRLKANLRSPKAATRLKALRDCSDLLLVSNEDNLGASFSTSSFATEFIAILNGKPNIDKSDGDDEQMADLDDMDEDAQLAAALALSTGGAMPGDDQDEMEAQLLACRCLAHLMEALPGSGHTLVHLGAVPVLCSKLNEISYIELAEQTLSTMEKISAEYPAAIVREGGLAALLNFLPFFSTNVQRTAVTAAANCCRSISYEHFAMIRDVFPTIRDVLTQSDQRLVEQATLAVVRTLESYRHSPENLEGLLDVPTVTVINALLMPSGGSPLISDSTYTLLLKALTAAAKASGKVTLAFLEAGVTSTVHHILTGVLPSSHEEDEQGDAPGGQSLGGGVADMAIMQNLAHRPKDQVEEVLGLISELLPPLPQDGVFDPRAYNEKSLARIQRRTGRNEGLRRSSRTGDTSSSPTAPGTPAEPSTVATPSTPTPLGGLAHLTSHKSKRDAEMQKAQRLALLKSNPEIVAKFMRALVPVLVDVYAASVSLRVRTKALTGLVKAIAFAEPDDLQLTLTSVPMASFLGSIISSKDNPTYVLFALQIVELLATKLPDVYLTPFVREGVSYEVESLAKTELSTAPQEPAEREGPANKIGSTADGAARDLSETAAVDADARAALNMPSDVSGFLSSLIHDSPTAAAIRRLQPSNLNDANIIRARIIGVKNIFSLDGEQQNEASKVLEELGQVLHRLCLPEGTEAELRETLREIASKFSNAGQCLSSFELMKSGLVDGLLDYADIDGAVSSSERRAILFEVFSDTSIASPSPLVMLVKRLHESLGRLEDFEVETAFNGLGGSSLARSMRIRLQAEDGEDIPRQISTLSVTIQAIAPVQALHDYLRPRIADPSYLSGASTLQSMFAAYAASRGAGTGNSSTSRLLAALSAGARDHSAGDPRHGTSRDAPGATTSSAQDANASSLGQAKEESGPTQRRRSARLSGHRSADTDPLEHGQTGTSETEHPDPGILPEMPVSMDFDDDFSEEEYDAEVFEEDMEEEIERPQEKVVNMSVAADGSKVEAKTPDGTRVATPNQAATSTRPTGSATPSKSGSYAGAVKSVPADWHLEFSLNGQVLSLEDTIYGAVHKLSKKSWSGANTFNLPVTFMFRKVNGPASSTAIQTRSSQVPTTSDVHSALDPTSAVSKSLRLLRLVHSLSVEGREAGGSSVGISETLFVNNKVTAKLTRQLEETMILASNCLPAWAIELPKQYEFLFPFETRYAFLRSTSFGYGRLIAHWQASQPRNSNSNRRDDLAHLGRLVRQKVRISRAQLLESCAKVLELYGTSNGILEVEYFDEIGTGLGPTLEFYSLASREFARRSLRMWRDEDETKTSNYVFHPHGLFPAPTAEGATDSTGSPLAYFKTLGIFVARALLDSRIIDLNLNRVFIKLLLGAPIKKNVATLKHIDVPLARSLEGLQTYLQARKEIEALTSLPPSSRRSKLAALTIGGAKLHDLFLDFTLPGYDIELKDGGRMIDVDDSNLEEYLDLVLDKTLGSGVSQPVRAFQEGFSMIFPIADLQVFSPEELELLFGNSDEDWSKETLEQSIRADHGYNSDSRTVRNLIEVMSEYDKDERREFLQFITGAPKLPIGGFRGLNPAFTVVRKPHEPPFKADDYLPSVMTCAQYLKLPDYTSKEKLNEAVRRAWSEGGGSFHLS